MFILNGNAERVIKTLRTCGLTEYESKVYFTLLLTDRSKMLYIAKKSSVPQSKIYSVMDSLNDKGLVDVSEDGLKTARAKEMEQYLSREINARQNEISKMIDAGNLIGEIIHSLRPIAIRYKDKYRVFEPKHRRR
jgi:sugar-specific transcriptional regulator TrmB